MNHEGKNMESGPEKFDETKFMQRFDDLFRIWRATWATGSSEPQRITGRTRKYLSPEQLEANRPEGEAYSNLMDYCTEVMVSAVKIGKHREAFAAVENALSTRQPMEHVSTIRDFLSDLFRTTLDKFLASEKERNPEL